MLNKPVAKLSASETGGHAPLDAFESHQEAQDFVVKMRALALQGAPKDDLVLMGKVYALFDAASAGFYLHDSMSVESFDDTEEVEGATD